MMNCLFRFLLVAIFSTVHVVHSAGSKKAEPRVLFNTQGQKTRALAVREMSRECFADAHGLTIADYFETNRGLLLEKLSHLGIEHNEIKEAIICGMRFTMLISLFCWKYEFEKETIMLPLEILLMKFAAVDVIAGMITKKDRTHIQRHWADFQDVFARAIAEKGIAVDPDFFKLGDSAVQGICSLKQTAEYDEEKAEETKDVMDDLRNNMPNENTAPGELDSMRKFAHDLLPPKELHKETMRRLRAKRRRRGKKGRGRRRK